MAEGEGEGSRVQCAKEETPIAAAKSHDPIANSSMIHPAKSTRRSDRHESITRSTTSVTVTIFLRDRAVEGKGTRHDNLDPHNDFQV